MKETREQWLERAVVLLADELFKPAGYKVPKVRVSCGWPRGTKTAIGQCWPGELTEDKLHQVFISPSSRKPVDVLEILVHELVHAVVGCDKKHGKVFRKCAQAVGLEGKMTATHGGKELIEKLEVWVKKTLRDYPHAAIKPGQRLVKKQTTRMVLCKCPTCGYQCRTSRKWLLESGAPLCPRHEEAMEYSIPDELKGDDDDE